MRVILFISFCLGSQFIYGQTFNKQNTFIDALDLAKIYDQNSKLLDSQNSNLDNAYYSVLRKYGIDAQNIKTNPFLSDLIINLDSSLVKNAPVVKRKNNKLNSVNTRSSEVTMAAYQPNKFETKTPSQSVSWEAAVINGTSNFMASRFKQEILHIGINHIFSKIVRDKDSNICRYLFPKSFHYIGNLYGEGDNSYYSADLLILKHSAQLDLENFHINLVNNTESIFPKSENINKIKDVLSLSYQFMNAAKNGYSHDQIIHYLASRPYSNDSNLSKLLNIVDLISQATLNLSKESDYWIPLQRLKIHNNIEQENLELRFFYALLYQQLIQIPELREYILISDQNDIKQSLKRIQELLTIADQLNQIPEYLKSHKFSLNSAKDFNNYLTLHLNIFVNFNSILSKGNISMRESLTINQEQIAYCTKFFSIVDAINTKEYYRILPTFILEFGSAINQRPENLRTLAFISNLASINNTEDMENLLTANALPIGGASIKRHSKLNVSFNGYVGLTGGTEWALASQQTQIKPNLGLAAPIGISVTGNNHLTYFFSVLDLGSIVNQRFGNDTNSYSNFKFEHFFTPGLGFFYNLKNMPLTLGFHGNYIPNLRNIKYENNGAIIAESNVSVFRFNFSVLVDIPFFTLYNREIKTIRRFK